MTLSAVSMTNKIKSKIGADVISDEYLHKLCEAIIEEIQDNATVNFLNVSTVVSPAGNCSGVLQNGKIN